MNYSRQYLAVLSNKTNFIKDNLEKVLRLAEVLKFLNSDIIFKDNVALKGGTAINLTAIKLSRLSVDIDLDFTKNISKDEIIKVKELFTERLVNYMRQEGYSLVNGVREHYALNSYVFSYINNAGNKDNIKVEINFMNRCHILPLEYKKIINNGIIEPLEICSLNNIELYASKINALLSRATPRDLYDVNAMIENNIIKDLKLLKKCLIFYNVIGGNQNIDNIDFSNIENINYKKYKTQLKPVISKIDKFDLNVAKNNVIKYLKELIILEPTELSFINEFKNGYYKPNLLFDEENILNNIIKHPMALWRCMKKTVAS